MFKHKIIKPVSKNQNHQVNQKVEVFQLVQMLNKMTELDSLMIFVVVFRVSTSLKCIRAISVENSCKSLGHMSVKAKIQMMEVTKKNPNKLTSHPAKKLSQKITIMRFQERTKKSNFKPLIKNLKTISDMRTKKNIMMQSILILQLTQKMVEKKLQSVMMKLVMIKKEVQNHKSIISFNSQSFKKTNLTYTLQTKKERNQKRILVKKLKLKTLKKLRII